MVVAARPGSGPSDTPRGPTRPVVGPATLMLTVTWSTCSVHRSRHRANSAACCERRILTATCFPLADERHVGLPQRGLATAADLTTQPVLIRVFVGSDEVRAGRCGHSVLHGVQIAI